MIKQIKILIKCLRYEDKKIVTENALNLSNKLRNKLYIKVQNMRIQFNNMSDITCRFV